MDTVIDIKQLCFRYLNEETNQEVPVLQGVNMKVKKDIMLTDDSILLFLPEDIAPKKYVMQA